MPYFDYEPADPITDDIAVLWDDLDFISYTTTQVFASTIQGSTSLDAVEFPDVSPDTIEGSVSISGPGISITVFPTTVALSVSFGANQLMVSGRPEPATISSAVRIPLPAISGDEGQSIASTPRWVLEDPETGASYEFEVNPSVQDLAALSKGILYKNTAAPNRRSVIFEANQNARQIIWRGRTFTQSQYATFESWYEAGNVVELTDDLGREFEIYITEYSPKRVKSVQYPWLHDYEIRATITAEL